MLKVLRFGIIIDVGDFASINHIIVYTLCPIKVEIADIV